MSKEDYRTKIDPANYGYSPNAPSPRSQSPSFFSSENARIKGAAERAKIASEQASEESDPLAHFTVDELIEGLKQRGAKEVDITW